MLLEIVLASALALVSSFIAAPSAHAQGSLPGSPVPTQLKRALECRNAKHSFSFTNLYDVNAPILWTVYNDKYLPQVGRLNVAFHRLRRCQGCYDIKASFTTPEGMTRFEFRTAMQQSLATVLPPPPATWTIEAKYFLPGATLGQAYQGMTCQAGK